MKEFLNDRNPNGENYAEIAHALSCQVKHVKNWFSYKRKIILKLTRNPQLMLKPKQELILQKLLQETTQKLENTEEEFEETVEKIKEIEEKNKFPIKIEEEKEKERKNSHQSIVEDLQKEEDKNSFMKENAKNWMFFQNSMKSYFQGLWMKQMSQNYLMQNYNNWVNFNKFKHFLSNQSN